MSTAVTEMHTSEVPSSHYERAELLNKLRGNKNIHLITKRQVPPRTPNSSEYGILIRELSSSMGINATEARSLLMECSGAIWDREKHKVAAFIHPTYPKWNLTFYWVNNKWVFSG